MVSYSPIIVLIVNVLRVLLLKKVMDVFFSVDDIENKSIKIGLGIYCLLATTMYSIFGVSASYEICNCLGITLHHWTYLFLSGIVEKKIMAIVGVI